MSHQHPRAWFGSAHRALALAVAAACACTGAAHAQQNNPYFVSNELEGEMALSVALSDGDLLTFRAAGPGGTGMFGLRPSSPPIAGGTVLTIRGLDFASPAMSPPSTNSSGDFAFTDFDNGASALFVRRGGGNLLTINGSNFRSPSMGSDGTVFTNAVGASGAAELLAYPPGGNHITIVGSSDAFAPTGRAAQTSGGTVVTAGGSAIGEGLFAVAPGGWSGTIPDLPSFRSFSSPAASGETAVFAATDQDNGVRGVFAIPVMGGSIITIRGENLLGPALDFSEPAANDAGAVVFARLGAANGGIERIEYGDLFGSEVRTLIALGDELLGSTVTGLTFNADGLNEAGDFGYGVQLADGRSAIMIASNIPAPGSLVLLGIGAAATLRRRR
jgi:hypothetical protein